MRLPLAPVRQSPQPLHFWLSIAISPSRQVSRGVRRLISGVGDKPTVDSSLTTPTAWLLPPEADRSGQSELVRPGPTILPGLNSWRGSKIDFTSRKTGKRAPYWRATHAVRARPVPCWELTVPPR